MKSRQWLITLGLAFLALVAVIGGILTRDAPVQTSNQDKHAASHLAPLVDERPLQTSNNVAKLASSWDGQRLANQALKAADGRKWIWPSKMPCAMPPIIRLSLRPKRGKCTPA